MFTEPQLNYFSFKDFVCANYDVIRPDRLHQQPFLTTSSLSSLGADRVIIHLTAEELRRKSGISLVYIGACLSDTSEGSLYHGFINLLRETVPAPASIPWDVNRESQQWLQDLSEKWKTNRNQLCGQVKQIRSDFNKKAMQGLVAAALVGVAAIFTAMHSFGDR